MNKQRVLFLCTHNSARSQMSEGFLRSMVKSEGCWKINRGRTGFGVLRIAAPIEIVDPEATAALAASATPAHFRSFCTTGDGRLTAGATR